MTRRALLIVLPLLFCAALLIRAATVLPLAIDVDEAWFSASGASLGNPFDFFKDTLDNKPPGTVWFFWLVAKLAGGGTDPRPARAACILLVTIACWLIGRVAMGLGGLNGKQHATRIGLSISGWYAALTCFLATALPSPEMLATTSEALMLPLLCLPAWAFFDPWPGRRRMRWLLAGLGLGGSLLVKQTAVFFFPYGLFMLALAMRSGCADLVGALGFIFGAAVFPLGLIAGLGADRFWYWCVVYPLTVLAPVRQTYFDQLRSFFMNVVLVAVAWLPLWIRLPRGIARIGSPGRHALAFWWLSASGAILVGHGLFLHYFLFLVPPLAICFALAWDRWTDNLGSAQRLGWLGTGFAVVCLLASGSQFGVLWGTDLAYYSQLGALVRQLTSQEDRVFVWGGNALPLAAAGRRALSGFVTARFAALPYATPATLTLFRKSFESVPPELVVDLHERGDGRFNVPIASQPWLQERLNRDYIEYHDPWLPWARFYLRGDMVRRGRGPATRLPATLIRRSPGADASSFDRKYLEISDTLERLILRPNWSLLESSFLTLPVLLQTWDGLRILAACDRELILNPAFVEVRRSIGETLERFQGQDIRTGDRDEARTALVWVRRQLEWRQCPLPRSMVSWTWWPSLALVKFQPVALPR